MAVTALKQEVDPQDVGLDAARLGRIESHFSPLVDDGTFPGFLVVVSRGGKIAHLANYGWRDIERRLPVETDTVFRIYSMTKPITSVAAMILYEEGRFRLTDPVSDYIASFADARVYVDGSYLKPVTRPATEPVRVWHLMTHTAGLTYGWMFRHACDAMYRAAGFEWGGPKGYDLERSCDAWASLPLMFDPGSSWNYSVATDVLGRLVEIWSGKPLDDFFAERIFEPLQMTDTAFDAERSLERLAVLYTPDPATQKAQPLGSMGSWVTRKPSMLSGGGGLVSTAGDYHRFAQMLLGRGELDGVRILGPRTLDYMTCNHLPGGRDLASFGHPISGDPDHGLGFGLGFSVVLDDARHRVLSSVGELAWGGAASTCFWVDPAEDLTVVFMTQLLPSSTVPVRPRLTPLVYQAIVD